MVTDAQKNPSVPVFMQPKRTVLLSERDFSTLIETKSHVHHITVQVHPNNPTAPLLPLPQRFHNLYHQKILTEFPLGMLKTSTSACTLLFSTPEVLITSEHSWAELVPKPTNNYYIQQTSITLGGLKVVTRIQTKFNKISAKISLKQRTPSAIGMAGEERQSKAWHLQLCQTVPLFTPFLMQGIF